MPTTQTSPAIAVAAGAAAGVIAAVVFRQSFWLGLLVGGGAGFGVSAIAATQPKHPIGYYVSQTLPLTQAPATATAAAKGDAQGSVG
jgi:hypothetical protein